MSVHNSVNGDDYVEDPDPVTLISKLDISDPLHLHPNDTIALTVVSIKLKGTKNYQYDAMIELPKCVCNASKSFKKHNQLLKLMQFLMSLDDSYMKIRSSILFREVLPDVRSAYATISSEESHRVAAGSIDGANQHMTYIDKELDNVFDISHLRIKVGHPNGIEAYIIRLKISENKVIVAFDESRCYFLNQDLNLKNVLGIGDQCEGLLGHPAELVLDVLKDSLQIDKKDNTVCCEICQRAKQTKEPFPLSDHTSKCLGDLVHLDLWGPYKVTISKGFRYFLTVVDDYTRAV
ncbi:hypothetical protein Tco_0993848 [Tanacetum coccineum]